MSRFYSYINTAKVVLSGYSGDRPFSLFLKDFFKQHKKHGSTDRKQIAHLCYCYFRLGKAGKSIQPADRIITALFLCSTHPNKILSEVAPELNDSVHLSLEEKLNKIKFPLHAEDIFPWKDQLSTGIDYTSFAMSHLRQPDLYLRIRPGFEGMVEKKLAAANITFNHVNERCLSLDNSSKLDDVIELDKEAVVQDLNSQRVGEMVPLTINEQPLKIWDCCAASGGKSILFHDLFPAAKLTVSDIRNFILNNLAKRFQQAGITGYRSIIADLTTGESRLPATKYDLVICDAPCTGSGTWGRTPEQLYFFDDQKIDYYANLQQKISGEASKHIKLGGYFLYITCSVFKKENEEVIKKLQIDGGLKLVKMELLKGYDQKADTLFATLLQKQ